MRVLFVSPVVPDPPDSGGRLRTQRLLVRLGARAEVHLACVRQPGYRGTAAALADACASVRVLPRTRSSATARLLRSKPERWFASEPLAGTLAADLAPGAPRFDLVHLDEPCLVGALPRALDVPLVVHHHKLDVELWDSVARVDPLRRAWERAKLARLEARAARATRHHVVCSDADARRLLARHAHLAPRVVPNGFEPGAPPVDPRRRDPERLVFVGTLSYAPNVDALEWFVERVLPRVRAERPSVRLDVVGREPERVAHLARPGVEIVGGVHRVRPWLDRAAASVVPLRIGGGSRLKIPEALGSGTPVVTTSVGVEGLAFEHGEHLCVADGSAAFARAVLDTLGRPREARARAERGRARAIERHAWPVLADRLLDAWRAASAGAAPTARPQRGARTFARTSDHPSGPSTSSFAPDRSTRNRNERPGGIPSMCATRTRTTL